MNGVVADSAVTATSEQQQQQPQQDSAGPSPICAVGTLLEPGSADGDEIVSRRDFVEETLAVPDDTDSDGAAGVRSAYQKMFGGGGGGGGGSSHKRRRHPGVHSGCDCEFQYRDYTWRKFTEYEPSRNGVEVSELYVVSLSGKELFTYAEGAWVGNTRTESRFPFVCGEIVSAKKLASPGRLKDVYAWVQMSSADDADAYVPGGSEERPLHLLQRREDSTHRTLTGLPLTVDRRSKVVVFRTHGDSLYVQLMPTVRSTHRLIPGTPLFDKNNRGIRAAVGHMFSRYYYVVNCTPSEYCEIPVYKNKHGSDRLRVYCVDRRGIASAGDRVGPAAAEKTSIASSVMSLVNLGVEAVVGAATSSVGTSPTSGLHNIQSAVVGALGAQTASSAGPCSSDPDESSENELIYKGVVNEKLQVTDSFTQDKKNKVPRALVTVVIDDGGVRVHYTDDGERTVFRWSERDPNTSYSIMPRRFFNAKASVVTINTAARSHKKESMMKRYKSQERLI